MAFEDFLDSFTTLVEESPSERLGGGARYVVVSDLHMGDGGSRDDLVANRALLRSALREWYLPRGYTLVLNGDIEELHKFTLAGIRRAWAPLYAVFDEFAQRGALRKIVGNHDLSLLGAKDYPYEPLHGLSLLHGERRFFVFHGHQASRFFSKHNYLSDFIVRYLAKPLNVKNASVSRDSQARYKTERRIYKAARRLGIAAVAGHTHRPLFESLSKYDSLRWSMESLLREYPAADEERRRRIADLVGIYRGEFERLKKRDRKYGLSRGLYEDRDLVVPCLFNSGCATGKNGFTALEFGDDAVSLVHWADAAAARPYLERQALAKEPLEGRPYARYVLGHDSLDYVFARIDLLGSRAEEYVAI